MVCKPQIKLKVHFEIQIEKFKFKNIKVKKKLLQEVESHIMSKYHVIIKEYLKRRTKIKSND